MLGDRCADQRTRFAGDYLCFRVTRVIDVSFVLQVRREYVRIIVSECVVDLNTEYFQNQNNKNNLRFGYRFMYCIYFYIFVVQVS